MRSVQLLSVRGLLAAVLLASLLVVLPPPPSASVQASCPSTNGYDNTLSTRVGGGNEPKGQQLETYSRNTIVRVHCYNDHYHQVRAWENGSWHWKASGLCSRWSTGGQFHQDWSTAFSTYQCWMRWNVVTGKYFNETMDAYSVSSRHHLNSPSKWDYDEATATDCWRRNANGTWTRSCV